jgi:hypothetical protein
MVDGETGEEAVTPEEEESDEKTEYNCHKTCTCIGSEYSSGLE